VDPQSPLIVYFTYQCLQSGIPIAEQSIHFKARELTSLKESLHSQGVDGDEALLLLRRKVANPATGVYVASIHAHALI
jgi:hypothetical protein